MRVHALNHVKNVGPPGRHRPRRRSWCRDRFRLREVIPGLRHLAIMSNAGYPAAVLEMGEAESAARTVGLNVVRLEIRRAQDIAPAFEALKGRAEALYITTDPILNSNHVRITTLANLARLPMIATQREFVDAGSLM